MTARSLSLKKFDSSGILKATETKTSLTVLIVFKVIGKNI